jgi:hypothetical protein
MRAVDRVSCSVSRGAAVELNANSAIPLQPRHNGGGSAVHRLVGSPGMICRSGSGPIEI